MNDNRVSDWTEEKDGSRYTVALYSDGFSEAVPEAEPAIGGQIIFQHGPVREFGINGTTIEVVIGALANRLRGFNNQETFRCRENSLAITHLEEALHWLEARTKARQAQGVEGRNIPH